MTNTTRSVSVDVARGIIMLYIVAFIHGVFWLHLLPRFIRSAMLFEMPCIFIISGYAYYLYENTPGRRKPLQSYANYILFLATRLTRILVPYFVYAIFALTLFLLLGGESGKQAGSFWESAASWFNPVTFGGQFSFGMLNKHLWFIAPFLAVTALLPFLGKIPFIKIPLWEFMIGISLLIFFISFQDSYLLKTIFFYSIWAIFGYHLARPEFKFDYQDYLPVFLLALYALMLLRLISPSSISLDMQANKFPPNFVFFIFICVWVSLLLMLTQLLNIRFIERLSRAVWLKPFINCGYSIYLWQGAGYATAIYLGNKFGLPEIIVWFFGLVITIILGSIAAPIERLRIRS